MAAAADLVPAAGRAGLTRFYDAAVTLTMREPLVRGRLVADVELLRARHGGGSDPGHPPSLPSNP